MVKQGRRIIGLLSFAAVAGTETGAKPVAYGVGDWPQAFGNHRVVVEVTGQSDAVRVHVPWRRRDSEPERKAVWVMPSGKKEKIENVSCPSITREAGDIVFEPVAGASRYYCYYMPYTGIKTVKYTPSKETAGAEWKTRHGLDAQGLEAGKWRDLPQARVVEIQAINEFHRFDPMELPATAAEMKAFLASTKDAPFVLFPEDRRNPIRMRYELPVHWIKATAEQRRSFSGKAQRGEYYAFQIGVFAQSSALEDVRVAFGDLKDGNGNVIAASEMACINTGGTDCLGQSFRKQLDVSKGKVQPLWCGVAVPEDTAAGSYTGALRISARNMPAKTIDLTLDVSTETIPNSGDDDVWRHSRLRWLNSTIGLDDDVYAPFDDVSVDNSTVNILGRRLEIGGTGLPASIVSTFGYSVDSTDAPPRELLAAPMRFVVKHNGTTLSDWHSETIEKHQPGSGAVEWTVTSKSGDFELNCRGKMECDGYVNYQLTLRTTEAAKVEDIALEIPFRTDVARYMMGLGREGGDRPEQLKWKWNVGKLDNNFWIGDVNAGLHCRLKHVSPHWSIYSLRKTGVYRDWSGEGEGGCTMREEGDRVNVRAYTGPMNMAAGRELHFNFGMLITPVRTLNKNHWNWRYYHKARLHSVAEAADKGANIINLHQGHRLNPYINYPFRTVDKLSAYAQEAHKAGIKVKLYYTVRELSNYAAELWALRSLGDEILREVPRGFKLADVGLRKQKAKHVMVTSSWLTEHLINDYVPAWHQPLGNGHCDASIGQQGLSRWHNYYLEGLGYLIRNVGMDGLYLDGIGYDREIMKRVRKVMQSANPDSLIDFHSGNNFRRRGDGKASPTSMYMELYPCIDSLWFGEGFDYNRSPDYWLTEVSGIPFGMFGEMLHGGGNPWRGMLYGMTGRLGWAGGADPRGMWKFWDTFGIADARMIGYWDPACPVRTGRNDVLATAYVRDGKMLIALASWAGEPVKCKLDIDFDAIGLKAESACLHAPEIDRFQSASNFDIGAGILVPPGRGWLVIVDEQHPERKSQADD